ncbi:MAG: SGNH/GDSL hydrolase family protein [Leeuwenhoekiella sp.]
MKMTANFLKYSLILPLFLFGLACSKTDDAITLNQENPEAENPINTDTTAASAATFNYLALGDSYTIGQSVCEGCSFPIQLEAAYNAASDANLQTKIIATTGWRTDQLIKAIAEDNPDASYDIVTLLIGVNNQYQHTSFSQYETEFPKLLETAIRLAGGDKNNVIVVSIPDYAFTPYGQSSSDPQKISDELEKYNAFAKAITENKGVTFLNITDITQRGLQEPELVASDGLHPSALAYKEFVERLLPLVKEKID